MSITITYGGGRKIPTDLLYSNKLNSLNTAGARSVLSTLGYSALTAQYSNNSQVDYGLCGPFASQKKWALMCSDAFGKILSYFEPNELPRSKLVCKNWSELTESYAKEECQSLMSLKAEDDPKYYLPKDRVSYTDCLQLVSSRIFGRDAWERDIGRIGPVPPIPEAISPKKWNHPDPCDATRSRGKECVWVYVPREIEVDERFSLDNPNDPEASKLIYQGAEVVKDVAGKILKTKSEHLKVPVNLSNALVLFKNPKTGNSLTISPDRNSHWNQIISQHGSQKAQAGWYCMSKSVFGADLSGLEQQARANERGVTTLSLLNRIIFNFMLRVRSPRPNFYPDGGEPLTLARTSTVVNLQERTFVACVGGSSNSGLEVSTVSSDTLDETAIENLGLAVALPAEVPANDS